MLQWGLIPRWVKDSDAALNIANKTLNARSDTVFEKVSFKNAIVTRRSLLPVNGFVEWRHEGAVKKPFLVRGIGDALMRYVHNNKLRMPVVIDKADRSTWVSDIDRHAIEQLMRPFPEHRLQAIPLLREMSRIASNNDNPDLLKPIGKAIVDSVTNNT